jgi:hypothetical protein
MIVLGMLNARYPSGDLREVELILTTQEINPFIGDFLSQIMEDFLDTLRDTYHAKIGPAYALEDFTYEFWFVRDHEELRDLLELQPVAPPRA